MKPELKEARKMSCNYLYKIVKITYGNGKTMYQPMFKPRLSAEPWKELTEEKKTLKTVVNQINKSIETDNSNTIMKQTDVDF